MDTGPLQRLISRDPDRYTNLLQQLISRSKNRIGDLLKRLVSPDTDVDAGRLQRLTSIGVVGGLFALLVGAVAILLGALSAAILLLVAMVVLMYRLRAVAAWAGLCALFSLFIGSGAIVPGLLIIVMLFAVIVVMLGPHFIAASWLIGSPTLFGFPNDILSDLPFVTMERLLWLMLLGIVLVKYAFEKRKTPWLPLEIAIFAFLLYALVNLLMHTDAEAYKRDGWLWTQYLLAMGSFIISRRIHWSDRRLKMLLAALTATGVFVAMTGILQSSFGITVFTPDFRPVASGHVARAYGTFGSAQGFSTTVFILLGISLLQYGSYRDALMRSMLIVAMAVMAVGIFLGQTRGPWIGASIALVIIFVKHPPVRPLLVIGGFVALVIAIVLTLFMIDELGGVTRRISDIGTVEGRLATWNIALNMIADNPVFGLGFGPDTFYLNEARYLSGIGALSAKYQSAFSLGYAHNDYLQVAVLLGIPGLVLFLLVLLRLVKLMFELFHDKNEGDFRRHLALYVGAILVALMFNSFFSDTFVEEYFWALTFFLAGIAAGNLEQALRPASRIEQGGKSIVPGAS